MYLYLDNFARRHKKQEIELYVDVFNTKIRHLFDNIESEAERIANEFYLNYGVGNPDADSADGADLAIGLEVDYCINMYLMRYNTIAMWITMLAQYWEQQVREYLYQELSRRTAIDATKFCTDFNQVRKLLDSYGIAIDKFPGWPQIKELRLLCKALKHGEGDSLNRLKKLSPSRFVDSATDLDFILPRNTTSTLQEQVLQLDPELFNKYASVLVDFWDWMPQKTELVERP